MDVGEGPGGTEGEEQVPESPCIQDPEQSLMALGSASLRPTALSAASQATVLPDTYGLLSPKESLHALGM